MGIMIEELEDDFQVALPTVTFSDRMTLDLGDVTLRLVYFGEAATRRMTHRNNFTMPRKKVGAERQPTISCAPLPRPQTF